MGTECGLSQAGSEVTTITQTAGTCRTRGKFGFPLYVPAKRTTFRVAHGLWPFELARITLLQLNRTNVYGRIGTDLPINFFHDTVT